MPLPIWIAHQLLPDWPQYREENIIFSGGKEPMRSETSLGSAFLPQVRVREKYL